MAADTELVYDPETYVTGVPHAALARLREAAAVSWVPERSADGVEHGPGYWAVWRHAEVKHVLKNPALYSSELGATQIRDPATPEDLAYVRKSMLNMDPPEHSRLRRIVNRSFTPRAVDRLRERIVERAGVIVDEMIAGSADGTADFAKAAADLPVWTLADVLGVPQTDRYLMFDWASRVIGFQDPEYATISMTDAEAATPMAKAALAVRPRPRPDGTMPDPRTRDGIPDLYAYAHELAAEKRRAPGDDIMSIMLSRVDGDGLSTDEFENMFWLFAVAGNETLRNGIPGGMYALLHHPDQWHRLAADRSLLPAAADEMLRWWTPVIHFRRTATQDTELAGVRIAAGDKVVVYFAAANRDPRVFADPDTFDVTRAAADHLSFGHGPHYCLGWMLGKAQLVAMFDALLDRFREVRPAGEPQRLRSNFQHGIKHLPISWTLR
ncbi:cytochrome P450 [Actinocatenispora rupis]|uniref:Cytochrome P450 n=1 Tax=Actinocatenispora rupis TaxID=519421 RepID=A0A8J3J4D2_9ACTN|nr:cytochrome P450 [Actinocatenispora rupis]GID11747.1 cytochrome P450 [Actinocatenispora rupis]